MPSWNMWPHILLIIDHAMYAYVTTHFCCKSSGHVNLMSVGWKVSVIAPQYDYHFD